MQLQLYEVNHGACPYLPDRNWVTHGFSIRTMPGPMYEEMLRDGWRRSGHTFYQNHCPGCSCCTATRVPVAEFTPSRSQRRVMARNTDVTMKIGIPTVDDETFELYRSYVLARHTPVSPDPEDEVTPQQLQSFLVRSAADTRAMQYRVGDRLVGVGWVDVLADGISSVYFAFDPAESRRSLGTYSIMEEMEYARSIGKSWLYLGFYVPGSPKMAYKGAFHPREFAVRNHWTRDEREIEC